MKRSLIYFSIIKIFFFFFAQFFRSIYYSYLALFSFFFRFDYFLLFRLLKFERVPPLFSPRWYKKNFSSPQSKLYKHSLQLLYQLSSSITNTIQLQLFASQETSRCSQGRDNSQPTVTDRQTGSLPPFQKFSPPLWKSSTLGAKLIRLSKKLGSHVHRLSGRAVFLEARENKGTRKAEAEAILPPARNQFSSRRETNFPRWPSHLFVANFSREKFRPGSISPFEEFSGCSGREMAF